MFPVAQSRFSDGGAILGPGRGSCTCKFRAKDGIAPPSSSIQEVKSQHPSNLGVAHTHIDGIIAIYPTLLNSACQ